MVPPIIFPLFFLSLQNLKLLYLLVEHISVLRRMIFLSICYLREYLFQRSAVGQLLHSSGCDYLSVLDESDLVAELLYNIEYMGRKEYGSTILAYLISIKSLITM